MPHEDLNIRLTTVTCIRTKPQKTLSVEKHAHPPRVDDKVSRITKFRVSNLHITSTPDAARTLHQHILQGRLFRHITSPSERRLVPSLCLGTTWVRQLLSGSCHYPTAATKCNEQPSHSKPCQWKSMLIHQGWFTALYSQHLLDSQSFEFLICILQALNMPLICCTNVFFQGRLSHHITSPCLGTT